MAIFSVIINFLASIFGSSQFADATHALLTSMGATADITVYDQAVKDAAAVLAQGATLAETIQQVQVARGIPEHHAAMVAAAAKAQVDQTASASAGA